MDKLEAMTVVLLTVEKSRLTAAAKALNMPLPTISRKVTELETYLGTKLLHRSTRKLTLTDAGEDCVSSIRRIMEDFQTDTTSRTRPHERAVLRFELV